MKKYIMITCVPVLMILISMAESEESKLPNFVKVQIIEAQTLCDVSVESSLINSLTIN